MFSVVVVRYSDLSRVHMGVHWGQGSKRSIGRGEKASHEGEELDSLVKKRSCRLRRIFSKELRPQLELCDRFSWEQQRQDLLSLSVNGSS